MASSLGATPRMLGTSACCVCCHRDHRHDFYPPMSVPCAQALQFLGLEGQSKWAFLGYESLFFCFFFACAWATVQFIRWDKR